MSKKTFFLLALGLLMVGLVFVFKMTDTGTALLQGLPKEGAWLILLVLVSSLIDSINPCAFSVLLITVAFLASASASRSKIMQIGGSYILGIFAVYVLIGLGILQALNVFGAPHFMARLGALILFVFGAINILGHYFEGFPIKFKIPDFIHGRMAVLIGKSSVPAVFLLGAVVALFEFPCTGGPYLMILGLLHDQSTYLSGLTYLLFYNLVFVSPLVLILFLSSEKSFLEKVEGWKKKHTGSMKLIGGMAMIGLGILIILTS